MRCSCQLRELTSLPKKMCLRLHINWAFLFSFFLPCLLLPPSCLIVYNLKLSRYSNPPTPPLITVLPFLLPVPHLLHLTECGASPDDTNVNIRLTPLQGVLMSGRAGLLTPAVMLTAVKLLLRKGANPDLVVNTQKTPAEIAKEFGDKDVFEVELISPTKTKDKVRRHELYPLSLV